MKVLLMLVFNTQKSVSVVIQLQHQLRQQVNVTRSVLVIEIKYVVELGE